MSIQCQSCANLDPIQSRVAANPHRLGANLIPIRCQCSQSDAKPVPIHHRSDANRVPIQCRSDANLVLIHRQSDVNHVPIQCQCIPNSVSICFPIPMSIHRRLGANPFPIQCQSVQPILCQSGVNALPIWCQSGANQMPIRCQHRANFLIQCQLIANLPIQSQS